MAQRGPNPFTPGPGFDPARPAAGVRPSLITNTRMELPTAAYALDGGFPSSLPHRPGINSSGKPVQIRVNQFKVAQWPTKDVYQFDIHIGNGAEKKGKIMVVWKSNTLQNHIKKLTGGVPWLWDGNKLAWTSYNVPEQRILVNLDAEKGRQPRVDRDPDTVYVVIRPTKTIRMGVIGAFLSKQIPFDASVLEAINFLDHLMRQYPSEQYTSQKRSFYARGQQRTALDNVIEAMKGVYTSIRLCEPKPSMGGPGTGLAINVDVANGTFWAAQDVHQAARNLCSARNRQLDYGVFGRLMLPVKDGRGGYTQSDDFKLLRKMAKLKFTVKHRGKLDDGKIYTIKKFTWNVKLGAAGVNAKNHTFERKNRDAPKGPDGQYPTVTQTVYQYFQQRYNTNLTYWHLPLIESAKGAFYPMEVCTLVPNQKYQFKLSPEQTQNMIKFAVTRPKERLQAINHGIQMLKWNTDPYLNHYGMKVDSAMTVTQARLLTPPEVQYSGKKANPGFSGRWDLRGMKFLTNNPEPLKSWGVCIIGKCVDKPTVQNFINVFVQTYTGHGGNVANRNPIIYEAPKDEDLAVAVTNARTAAGNQELAQLLPQILLFVLPGRDSFMYERLKKNMECRYAMVSQMMNVAHVKKAQPQYCSNVCMKLNAKLGGSSCKVADSKPPKPFFPRPTMIIGADVSHATPGSPQPSMAAITMSFDKDACRFAAAVQTNGHRVEMITDTNIRTMMIPLFQKWISKVGNKEGPQHIYYFRDGVSEGQYSHVLDQEVAGMKKALVDEFGPAAAAIKWTVTICTKRHHIRFFPKDGDNQTADRNSNALPGTLVERDITHPFEYDFYLCAHSAIQGTARPVHYHVIMDEAQVPVNDFQRMVYQMSYQYMRSTTPVSLFPAVYYAHLASNRARAHESAPFSDGPRGGQKYEEAQQDQAVAAGQGRTQDGSSQTGTTLPLEARPLLPLGNPSAQDGSVERIRTSMWYI